MYLTSEVVVQYVTLMKEAVNRLAGGVPDEAKELALQATAVALQESKELPAAQALFVAAQADILESRFSDAHGLLLKASGYFSTHRDVDNFVNAQALMSYCDSVRGKNARAVESAYLGTKLLEHVTLSVTRVRALNYLGVSLFWAGYIGPAHQAFDDSIWEARMVPQAEVAFHPWMNKACAEAAWLVRRRFAGEAQPDTSALHAVLASCMEQVHSSGATTLGAGTASISMVLLESLSSLASIWSDDIASGQRFCAAGLSHATHLSPRSWLHTVTLLAQTELALARQDLREALDLSARMVVVARNAEHLQMECVAHMSRCAVLELMGKTHDSLAWREATAALRRQEVVDFISAQANAEQEASAVLAKMGI